MVGRRKEIGDAAIAEGLAGLKLIEAEHEAEEALAIAVAMRETLETPGRTRGAGHARRAIARRVAAELARWDVEVENSAGATLGDTPAGVFARLALAAALDFSAGADSPRCSVAAVRLGRRRRRIRRRRARARSWRVCAPAAGLGGLEDRAAALAAARGSRASDRRAHPRDAKPDASRLGRRARGCSPISTPRWRRCARRRRPARQTRRGPSRGAGGARRAGADRRARSPTLLDEWAARQRRGGFDCGLADYAAMFETLVAGRARRRARADIRGSPCSACWRRGCSTSIASCSPGSTRRSGRRRREPTPSSIARCAPSSDFRRPSAASARPRTISSPALGAADAVVIARRRSARARRPSPRASCAASSAVAGEDGAGGRVGARRRAISSSRAGSIGPATGAARAAPAPKPPVELRPQRSSASPGSRRCAATPTPSTPRAS